MYSILFPELRRGRDETYRRCELTTLTFDLLTLKLVGELHLKWGTFLPNLGTLGVARPLSSRIIRYVRDGRTYIETDRQTDGQKQRLLPPSLRGRGRKKTHTGDLMKRILALRSSDNDTNHRAAFLRQLRFFCVLGSCFCISQTFRDTRGWMMYLAETAT